jgi:ankyrin repeat protein
MVDFGNLDCGINGFKFMKPRTEYNTSCCQYGLPRIWFHFLSIRFYTVIISFSMLIFANVSSGLTLPNNARFYSILGPNFIQRLSGGGDEIPGPFSDLKGAPIDNTTQRGMNKLSKGLRYAVMRGDIEAVESLLRAGAVVNAKDISGSRPLHLAAEKGQLDAVSFLLSKVSF